MAVPKETVAGRRAGATRTARRFLRVLFDAAFAALPFKHRLLTGLRAVVRGPPPFYRRLYFVGPFPVRVAPDRYFELYHYARWSLESEFFWRGFPHGWEAVSLAMWTRLSEISEEIWDVGANTGLYSLAARCVNPEARVSAFEPNPLVFRNLLRNLELNGYRDVCANAAALGEREAELLLHASGDALDTEAHLGHGTPGDDTHHLAYPVRVIAGDAYARERGVARLDLVKIDAEGHEREVVRGMLGTIAASRPSIFIEVLDDALGADLEQLLSGLGYLYFSINDDHRNGPLRARRVEHIARSDCLNYLVCTSDVAERIGIEQWL